MKKNEGSYVLEVAEYHEEKRDSINFVREVREVRGMSSCELVDQVNEVHEILYYNITCKEFSFTAADLRKIEEEEIVPDYVTIVCLTIALGATCKELFSIKELSFIDGLKSDFNRLVCQMNDGPFLRNMHLIAEYEVSQYKK